MFSNHDTFLLMFSTVYIYLFLFNPKLKLTDTAQKKTNNENKNMVTVWPLVKKYIIKKNILKYVCILYISSKIKIYINAHS
jgi:hypothetical protein